MSVVLRIKGLANGGETPLAGAYVKTYDPDAHGGRGSVTGTENVTEALRFPDTAAAFERWRVTSSVEPFRADGHPNRPLTAFTVEMLTVK